MPLEHGWGTLHGGTLSLSAGTTATFFSIAGALTHSATTEAFRGTVFPDSVILSDFAISFSSVTGDFPVYASFVTGRDTVVVTSRVDAQSTTYGGVTGSRRIFANSRPTVTAGGVGALVITRPIGNNLSPGLEAVNVVISRDGQIKQPIFVTTSTTLNTNSATRYHPFGESQVLTTETDARIYAPNAQTLSYFGLYISSNTTTTTTTFRIRNNGADGNQSLSVTSGATGDFQDTSNTDSITAGNYFNWSSTTGANSSTTVVISNVRVIANSGTASETLIIAGGKTSTQSTGDLYYPIIGAFSRASATESAVQEPSPLPGTFSKMTFYVSQAYTAGTTVARFRKNTANGNQSVTLTANTTGTFTDSSNSDTVAVDDLVNYFVDNTSVTGTMIAPSAAIVFTSSSYNNANITLDDLTVSGTGTNGTTGTAQSVIFLATTAGASFSTASVSRFVPLAHGNLLTSIDTESHAQVVWREATTFKRMRVRVDSNGRASSSTTVVLRKNAADTAMSISVPASTSGAYADEDDVSTSAGDALCVAVTTGSGTGSFSVSGASFFYAQTGLVVQYACSNLSPTAITAVGWRNMSGGATTTEADLRCAPNNTNVVLCRIFVRVTATSEKYGLGLGLGINSSTTLAVGNSLPATTTTVGFNELFLTRTHTTLTDYYGLRVGTANNASTTIAFPGVAYYLTDASRSSVFFGAGAFNHSHTDVRYGPCSYRPYFAQITESSTQVPVPCPGTMSRFAVTAISNSNGASATIKVRKNGADTAISLTITASTSGEFADNSTTVTFADGDLLSASYDRTGATAGTNMGSFSFTYLPDADGATGTASITLDALTAAGTGEVGRVGTAAITLDALTAAGTGTVAVVGTASITLDALTSTGTGTVAVVGTGAATLDALTSTGTGTVAVVGTAAITLGDLTVAGTGAVSQDITGTASITLADLTVAGTGAVFQRARPVSDVTVGTWTTDTGATTNLYAALDEETANDSDYIKSVLLDQGGGASGNVEVLLASMNTPAADTGHTLKVRIQHTSDLVGCDFFIELRQGATLIKQQQSGRGAGLTGVHEVTLTLSEAEAANITDYSDLRVRVYATGQNP